LAELVELSWLSGECGMAVEIVGRGVEIDITWPLRGTDVHVSPPSTV